ncbi:MAG TPA: hypothetical protein VKF32_11120 [Thermoanaerobaculia bacterium]|nr:hypothetical protein [Thermoanaerobaculia bacterium]
MQDLQDDSIPGVDVRRENVTQFGAGSRRALARGGDRAREIGEAARRGAIRISSTAGTLVDTREKRVAAYAALGIAFVVGFVGGLFAGHARD